MPRSHPVKVALAIEGFTQRRLAEEVGISAGTLSHVLNGHQQAWPSLRKRISKALDRPESELFPELVSR